MPYKPVPFKRGQTFSHLLAIPDTIADGALASYRPTAQVRKERSDSATGLIADIACYWADPATNRILLLHHNQTGKWPTGLAEFDVLFTHVSGQSFRSSTVLIDIQRGISK